MPRAKHDRDTTDGATADPPSSDPVHTEEGKREKRSEARLRAARKAIDAGDTDAGMALLEAILLARPQAEPRQDPAATEQRPLRPEPEEPAALRQAEHVEQLLGRGLVVEAQAALKAATSSFPASDLFAGFADRIAAELHKRQQRKEAEELIARAVELAGRDAPGPALEILAKARRLDPGPAIEATIRGLQERVTQQFDDFRRARGLGDALAGIETHLASANVSEARRMLALARRLYPHEARLETLAARIEDTAATQLSSRLEDLMTTAREALQRDQPERALGALDEALNLAPDSGEARTLRDGIRQREAVATVYRLLEQERFDDATRALEVAARLLPDEKIVAEVRERVADAEEKARAKRVDALVAAAREASRADRLERAVSLLQKAAGIDPGNPWVAGLLSETRLRDAEKSVELCLMVGDTASARRALDLAEKMFPGEVRLSLLRRRLTAPES